MVVEQYLQGMFVVGVTPKAVEDEQGPRASRVMGDASQKMSHPRHPHLMVHVPGLGEAAFLGFHVGGQLRSLSLAFEDEIRRQGISCCVHTDTDGDVLAVVVCDDIHQLATWFKSTPRRKKKVNKKWFSRFIGVKETTQERKGESERKGKKKVKESEKKKEKEKEKEPLRQSHASCIVEFEANLIFIVGELWWDVVLSDLPGQHFDPTWNIKGKEISNHPQSGSQKKDQPLGSPGIHSSY